MNASTGATWWAWAVLPLEFMDGEDFDQLGLDGTEQFTIRGLDRVEPRGTLEVRAAKADGSEVTFQTIVRLNTPVELDFYRHWRDTGLCFEKNGKHRLKPAAGGGVILSGKAFQYWDYRMVMHVTAS